MRFTLSEKENSVKPLIFGELKPLPEGLQTTPKGYANMAPSPRKDTGLGSVPWGCGEGSSVGSLTPSHDMILNGNSRIVYTGAPSVVANTEGVDSCPVSVNIMHCMGSGCHVAGTYEDVN